VRQLRPAGHRRHAGGLRRDPAPRLRQIWSGAALRWREARMKPVRRVVTGHRGGKAVVLFDSAAPNQKLRQASGLVSTLLWTTDERPADVSGTSDRAAREIGVPPA